MVVSVVSWTKLVVMVSRAVVGGCRHHPHGSFVEMVVMVVVVSWTRLPTWSVVIWLEVAAIITHRGLLMPWRSGYIYLKQRES